MIAKRIPSAPVGKPGSAGYARLARYIVDARGREDPRSWVSTADYILDANHSGAKVGGVRITNCASDEPALATMEIMATQDRNKRSTREKTYHLVISFPEGERPALSVLHEIEDRLCEAIGLEHHQRISAVHVDTAHLHVHVAINKVDPVTHRNVEPYYDQDRLMRECERLEHRFGLQRTNHGNKKEQTHERRDRIEFERRPNDDYQRAALRKSYLEAVAEDGEATDIDAVRDLSGIDVVRAPRGPSNLLLQNAQGQHLDEPEAARDELLRRLRGSAGSNDGEGIRINGRAGDFEANAGIESLIGFGKRTLAPDLAACESWEAAHQVAAQHGVELRLRGAGLVVVDPANRVGVRASSIERAMSLAQLEKRWGAFVPAPAAVQATRTARPLHPGAAPSLFSRFSADRAAARSHRASAGQQLRERHNAERAALLADFEARRARMAAVRGGLASLQPSHREKGVKRDTTIRPVRAAVLTQIRALAKERKAALEQLRNRHAQERKALASTAPLPGWQDWLRIQASRGDANAATALRSRDRKSDRWLANWIAAQDAQTASLAARADMRPSTDKRGRQVYQLADGGRVVDAKQGVRVAKTTEAAAFLALEIAAKRYASQALVIDGSDAFKRAVVRTAAAKGLAVTFKEPALNAMLSAERGRVPSPAPIGAQAAPPQAPAPAEKAGSAVQKYADARNAQRAITSTISYHRPWSGSDAGPAIYRGRRNLPDGSECVLLERDGTMLVLGVTAAQAAKASTWRLGAKVDVDTRGRFSIPPSHHKGPRR